MYKRLEHRYYIIDSLYWLNNQQSTTAGMVFIRESGVTTNIIHQICSKGKHLITEPIPRPSISECKAHFRSFHDIFINYRVSVEGKRHPNATKVCRICLFSSPFSLLSFQEPEGGMAELVYEMLARKRKRNNDAIISFWDKKCLNLGQNWENGFLHGISSSAVIILLISFKVFIPRR